MNSQSEDGVLLDAALRRIQPLAGRRDLVAGGAEMARPRFENVDPCDLLVDERYQRSALSDRSIRLIRGIVANWNWASFKPPVVVETGEGLHVIDGQHTAIAAATHNAIGETRIGSIPVMMVEAATLPKRASAFIGQNMVRVGVTKAQLFQAQVTAGDPDAVTAKQVCDRAGVRILLNPPGRPFVANETMAVSAIIAIANRHGAMVARQILEAVARGDVAPILARHLRAAEMLMRDKVYTGVCNYAELTTVIARTKDREEYEAKTLAAAMGLPLYRALAMFWFRQFPAKKIKAA